MIADFEKGIHKTLQETWPNVKVIGCRFHLLQSLYPKVQAFVLIKEYKDMSSLRNALAKLPVGLTGTSNVVGDFTCWIKG